jgi:hypothetical protein
VYLLSAMEVGDLVCETWRDGDGQQRMRPLPKPVWEVVAHEGTLLRVRRIGQTEVASLLQSDARLANENEIAEARA